MKVALVTGAYKGLGLAWCKVLSERGYSVVLTARDFEKAQKATFDLGPNVHPFALDPTDESQLKAAAEFVSQKFGKLDLLVNNAGINPKDFPDKQKMAEGFYLDSLKAETLLQVIHVNSIAPLLAVKHFRSLLKLSDSPKVVNVSSWLSSVTNLKFGGHYGYVGSKNLLNVFNKSMALEIQSDGICCVNVNPGWVQTEMGGSKATFTPEQAVGNLLNNIVDVVQLDDTGKFFNYDGTEHPW